ncbi:MAG: enoyl-CoA hydratase-related protein [Pseudomonadota bacterium]|nr:enoyl-CoA hydratase-related protein [Pseudomonadota bacterium]
MRNLLTENFKTVKIDVSNQWVTLWLNRPEAKNSISEKMLSELMILFDFIGSDKTIRGITLRGSGKCFCAGADLKEFREHFVTSKKSYAAIVQMNKKVGLLFKRAYTLPQLLVAVVEGPAFAGGLGLVCCADFVFATNDAIFSISETRIGLAPAQIAPYIIDRIGKRNAKKLMLIGESLNAFDAKSVGLVDQTFENDKSLSNYLQKFRETFNKSAPRAAAITKQIVVEIDTIEPSKQLNYLARKFADCAQSEEAQEGISAFFEKKQPNWVKSNYDKKNKNI